MAAARFHVPEAESGLVGSASTSGLGEGVTDLKDDVRCVGFTLALMVSGIQVLGSSRLTVSALNS
jgi:hypothetical protein